MLIIGEKLSIIAKRVREAMEKRDKGPIQEIAKRQHDEGSRMIDANIGPAEDGGESLMEWMVTTIQEAVSAPVCLDTTNIAAIEAGIKVHNNEWGKPIINSTSNDPERFPFLELAAKYQVPIIALTIGKGGLPADAEERAGIAAEMMARAMEYGLPVEELYLDPLVLQIALEVSDARLILLFRHGEHAEIPVRISRAQLAGELRRPDGFVDPAECKENLGHAKMRGRRQRIALDELLGNL